MQIEWTKVTWYSKVLAVFLGLAIFLLGIYVGQEIEENRTFNSETVQLENIVQFDNNSCKTTIYAWNSTTNEEKEFKNKCSLNDLPSGWIQITKSGEPNTWSTFTSENGYNFEYPSNYRIAGQGLILNENNNHIGEIQSGKTYDNPNGLALLDWLNQQDLIGDQKVIKDNFIIDNSETVHLFLTGGNGGTFDTFYFVKNNKLYIIALSDEESGMLYGKTLDLNNPSKWYNRFLTSFKIIN